MCISVDLPEPDGPITAVNWPFGTSIETPARASTADPSLPYRRVMSTAETAAGASPGSPYSSLGPSYVVVVMCVLSLFRGGCQVASAARHHRPRRLDGPQRLGWRESAGAERGVDSGYGADRERGT